MSGIEGELDEIVLTDEEKLYSLITTHQGIEKVRLLILAVKEFGWNERKFNKILKELISRGSVHLEL
ncbi:MAG: hypothetical protein ABI721_03205 [Candidatus Dojkabacteria bacterium]